MVNLFTRFGRAFREFVSGREQIQGPEQTWGIHRERDEKFGYRIAVQEDLYKEIRKEPDPVKKFNMIQELVDLAARAWATYGYNPHMAEKFRAWDAWVVPRTQEYINHFMEDDEEFLKYPKQKQQDIQRRVKRLIEGEVISWAKHLIGLTFAPKQVGDSLTTIIKTQGPTWGQVVPGSEMEAEEEPPTAARRRLEREPS